MSVPDVGIYEDVSFAEYLGWSAASNSRLQKLLKSPAHLREMLEGEDEETDAMKLGKAVHASVLEPDIYGERYVQAEQCQFTTGSGNRCSYAGKYLTTSGRWACGTHVKKVDEDKIVEDATTLTEDEVSQVKAMRDAVFASKAASNLLRSDGPVEISGVAEDPATEMLLKARADKISAPYNAIIDLKTTRDASRWSFERTIFNRFYHLQGALYLRVFRELGLKVRRYTIIAVEKSPPYGVATYRVTNGALTAGEELLDALLPYYRDTVARDEYPGYPDRIQEIAVPSWAFYRTDDMVYELEERR